MRYDVGELSTRIHAYAVSRDDYAHLTQRHTAVIRIFLVELMNGRRVDCYTHYFPDLRFPENSKLVGESLGAVWAFCCDHGWPWLNMLVVLKNGAGLPSSGVMTWYEGTFGTYLNYDRFCRMHAEMAEMALTPNEKGAVMIDLYEA